MSAKIYNMLQDRHMNIIYDVSHYKISQRIFNNNQQILGITKKIFSGKFIFLKFMNVLEIFPLIIPN